jgi:hypothetical protein
MFLRNHPLPFLKKISLEFFEIWKQSKKLDVNIEKSQRGGLVYYGGLFRLWMLGGMVPPDRAEIPDQVRG